MPQNQTTSPLSSPELDFAIDLAHKAGEIMHRYANGDQDVELKTDGTAVTIADKAINRMVIEAISDRFPEDGIVGEEESKTEYGAGRSWICDPIDGTAAFVVGAPTATFSLAFVIDGKPVAAVAYEPIQDLLFVALKGQGSYSNDKRLQVSSDTMQTGMIALAPDYVRQGRIDMPFMNRLLKYNKELAIFPGAVYRSCMVARGKIAGFPHPKVKPYDIAAVHLIVEEAGGKVTDVHGQALDYSRAFEGAIISNGVVHNELVSLFAEQQTDLREDAQS